MQHFCSYAALKSLWGNCNFQQYQHDNHKRAFHKVCINQYWFVSRCNQLLAEKHNKGKPTTEYCNTRIIRQRERESDVWLGSVTVICANKSLFYPRKGSTSKRVKNKQNFIHQHSRCDLRDIRSETFICLSLSLLLSLFLSLSISRWLQSTVTYI